MKVYCFGNEFLTIDSLAKEIADEIEIDGVDFIKCLGPDELPLDDPELTILDVAKGIDKVVILDGPDDLSRLKDKVCYSCHDMDLAFRLKLLKETGSLKNVRIIAIPQQGDKKVLIEEIKNMLKELKNILKDNDRATSA